MTAISEVVRMMLSVDLKQNTDSDKRAVFNDKLSGYGWSKCLDVDTTWLKVVAVDARPSANTENVLMELWNSVVASEVKEIAYVFQIGNAEPVSKSFLNPKLDDRVKGLERFRIGY